MNSDSSFAMAADDWDDILADVDGVSLVDARKPEGYKKQSKSDASGAKLKTKGNAGNATCGKPKASFEYMQ